MNCRIAKSPQTFTLRRIPKPPPQALAMLAETVAGSRSAARALDEVEAWLAQARAAHAEAKTRHVADARRGMFK